MSDVTIHDIARRANVSPAAVSYVINNRPGVGRETRALIQSIIDETGYTPSLTSRKLKLHRSFNIHVVVGSQYVAFDDLFYNSAIERMMDVCNENGLNLVLSSTDGFEQSTLARAIQQKDVDGVVFLQEAVAEAAARLDASGIPYVVVDAHDLSGEYHSVCCDYTEATRAATEHLIAHGHRQIGFVGPERIAAFFEAARQGYADALADVGVTVDDALICRTQDERSIPDATVDALLAAHPTAVVCATDILAVALIQRLAARGVRVPQDVSVCGVDDILLARYITPALSTVEVDKQTMGEEAIRLLLSLVDAKGEESVDTVRICIHSNKVVQRESVAALTKE